MAATPTTGPPEGRGWPGHSLGLGGPGPAQQGRSQARGQWMTAHYTQRGSLLCPQAPLIFKAPEVDKPQPLPPTPGTFPALITKALRPPSSSGQSSIQPVTVQENPFNSHK